MGKKDKPSRDERKAIKKTERQLSAATYQCPDCQASFGTEVLLGLHVIAAHNPED